MDDIYWLAKAVRQQNAMLQKLLDWLPNDTLMSADMKTLQDDCVQVNVALDHIDTKVIRG